jgi:hypothetical protein
MNDMLAIVLMFDNGSLRATQHHANDEVVWYVAVNNVGKRPCDDHIDENAMGALAHVAIADKDFDGYMVGTVKAALDRTPADLGFEEDNAPRRLALIAEDLWFSAERTTNGWMGTSIDYKTGKSQDFYLMRDDVLAAILWLVMTGCDDPKDRIANAMYDVAEPALSGWPHECRPIP